MFIKQVQHEAYEVNWLEIIAYLCSSSCNDVASVDDSRDVTQKGQDDVDQQISTTSLKCSKLNLRSVPCLSHGRWEAWEAEERKWCDRNRFHLRYLLRQNTQWWQDDS